MRKIIVITLFAVMLLAACDPVSVPDVSDVIPDIVNQEPKPDEKPEDKPPAENTPPAENEKEDTPPAEVQMEDVDILAPIVGKKYTTIDPFLNEEGEGVFDIQIRKTGDEYQIYEYVKGHTYPVIKGKDFKYRVCDYVISVSEDGKKITIGESVYEGTD